MKNGEQNRKIEHKFATVNMCNIRNIFRKSYEEMLCDFVQH